MKTYAAYKQSQQAGNFTAQQLYDNFRSYCPDGYFLMELRAWLESVVLAQFSGKELHPNFNGRIKKVLYLNGSNTLFKIAQPTNNQELIYLTKDRYIPMHKTDLKYFLQNLPNGIYYVSMIGQ